MFIQRDIRLIPNLFCTEKKLILFSSIYLKRLNKYDQTSFFNNK